MYSKDSIAEAPGAIRNTWWSIPICISTSIFTCMHVSFNYLHIMCVCGHPLRILPSTLVFAIQFGRDFQGFPGSVPVQAPCYGFGPLSRWVHCIDWRVSPCYSVPTLHAWRDFLLRFVSCLFGPFVMALVCRPGGYILYMVISSRIFTSTLIYISMSHSISLWIH